jgi:hypothetical protein
MPVSRNTADGGLERAPSQRRREILVQRVLERYFRGRVLGLGMHCERSENEEGEEEVRHHGACLEA